MMRDELSSIDDAIRERQLPPSFTELFSSIWDSEVKRFHTQETYVLDFKETAPQKYTDSYGAGIIRLILAFYNSYGGLIVFGVKDRELTVTGIDKPVDVESLNRVVSDFCGLSIECIAKPYVVEIEGEVRHISALLVPRRGTVPPAILRKSLGDYPAGKLWIRDRHEVIEAGVRHLPILYTERTAFPSSAESEDKYPIHRSLPPSPSTVKEFVNRGDLLSKLWSWFVLDDQPRLYLHGPGGSGKSTLAFQFAHSLADHGPSVRSVNGDRLDYVIFISAKETEFNSQIGRQQPFLMRQFETADEQFAQILYHSGSLNEDELESATPIKVREHLKELMSNFSGLIVLDDIDTLSRKGQDTGEELLFMGSVLAHKRTRILYTLRFPPANALNSAHKVPGLRPETEFTEFLEACCKQFDTASPSSKNAQQILEETSGLPLLVETVVGLRRYCSNYTEALSTFREKGGDEARRYLYQREYDRLETTGRTRQVLAALLLIEEPVSFTTISGLFQFSGDQVGAAISESSNVFLSSFEGASGETLYQLSPPCVPFVEQVSQDLSYFNQLQARVNHFRAQGARATPEDASTIVAMETLIRERKFESIVSMGERLGSRSSVLMNPRVRSLMGQAYSELGPNFREKARECFKHAEGLGHLETYMMRRWYNMEMQSGYGVSEAERICLKMINNKKIGPRYTSEFWSKLGACHLSRGNAVIGVSRSKGINHLKESIACYLEALWVGKDVSGINQGDILTWLERPIERFVASLTNNVEQFFSLLESLTERKHDIHEDGINLLLHHLSTSRVPADEGMQRRLKGWCDRTIATINRKMRPIENYPGFRSITDVLEAVRAR